MTLKVIGAGWGRTGTLSTKVALERLGFGPCYHMIEVFRTHPEHRAQWRRAASGEPIDWSGIFAAYRAAVDWPACAFWRELAEFYPEAKVLLTHRPATDWYESFDATISNGIPREHPGEGDETGAMMNEVIVQRSFQGRAGSRDELIARYEKHVAEVQAELPAERLLVWSPGDGWERLCDFLGVPVPAEPFPRINDRVDFLPDLRRRQRRGRTDRRACTELTCHFPDVAAWGSRVWRPQVRHAADDGRRWDLSGGR